MPSAPAGSPVRVMTPLARLEGHPERHDRKASPVMPVRQARPEQQTARFHDSSMRLEPTMTQESTTARSAALPVPMTAEQRAAFERDGYLIIRGALRPGEVAAARDAVDRVHAARARAGSLGPDGSMHLLSA